MGINLCKLYGKKRKELQQVGSVLDRVISQASNQDQCLLYKLANYKKGGELIEAYNIGGQIEVEKLIRDQFAVLMYADGIGTVINRAEYLRWKFRDQEQVILPIEASLSPHDPLAKWFDHEACWQMQYRGSLGETLLHVLIICDTKLHTKLARILIKCFPKLALDVVEGEEYLGASSLHLAIAYNNNELVQELIEAGANVNQRAIGSFFLPRDQQQPIPAKHTEYEGLAYLGEYPLAWAACCANESVYNLLLDSGAHPDLKDNFGNMILHMVVVCDKLDMFGYALRHPKLPASNGIVNNDGLTPLTLACKLGRAEVFREMLELSAKEFWRYSNITCSAYPLNALDTLLPDGRTNWNSALFIILNGTKEEHLDMLDGGIIQRLLEEKWKTFARNQFLKRLLILFIHLLCLSLAVYLRPLSDEPLLGPAEDVKDILRYVCEIGTVFGVLSYVIFQQGDEIKNQGLITFLKQQSHAPAKAVFLLSNLLILACIPCRLLNNRSIEDAILVFAVPGSWFLLMFFAGAVRLTGPFVTMIYNMITGDMLTFGIIYTVVLFGFSQSFYFLYKGHPNVNGTLYNSYATTWMALFQITLGDYNYSELSMSTYPALSKIVFALFMVFVPILLLNMLIAMMGNTYAHVIEQSEKEWMKQWAKIVVTLERAVPQTDAQRYLQEYSITLGPASDDPTMEQRGVMVIKSKSKTRAKQRKGAVTNWKRVGKVTIHELKKRGMTGEEMRYLMWGRESINTPIKTKKTNLDLVNPQVTTGTNCFGEALSGALDVMTFTFDLNSDKNQNEIISTDNLFEIPTQETKCIKKPQNDSSIFGTLTQLTNSQDLDGKNSSEFQDPFRALVINASKPQCNEDWIKKLAHESANIKNYEIIPIKTDTSIKNVAGIFAGIENAVENVEGVKRKSSLLETSDSETFENAILGKLSRTRRAISANIRNLSAKSKNSTRKLLHKSSSSSLNSNLINNIKSERELDPEKKMSTKEKLNFEVEHTEELKEDFDQNLRSVYVVSITENPNSVTEYMSSSNSEVEIFKKSKPKTRQRPKTAKPNRITPEVSVKTRRGFTAETKIEIPSEIPPNPLLPWSVKNISTMNKILAWENEFNSD